MYIDTRSIMHAAHSLHAILGVESLPQSGCSSQWHTPLALQAQVPGSRPDRA